MTESDRERERLIHQARHLIDEIAALATHVDSLPGDVLSSSPLEGERSIKEIYALIGLYDRRVYLPALEAMVAEENPVLKEGEDAELIEGASWNERPFVDVLDFTRRSREDLLQFLDSLEGESWNRRAIVGERNLTVFDVVYAVIQHDAELLRAAAQRFHDSRLSP